MCVIVIKPEGRRIRNNQLEAMWLQNPDGAGLAYWDNGKLYYEKGFMLLDDLKQALKPLRDLEVVVHFRMATHGKVTQKMTHPFIINPCKEKSKGESQSGKLEENQGLLFHNGVIHGYGDKTYSDTCLFTSTVLAKIPDLDTRYNVLDLIGGKYVIMQDGLTAFVGEFQDVGGLLVSNRHWDYLMTPKTKYKWEWITGYDDGLDKPYYGPSYEAEDLDIGNCLQPLKRRKK